MYIETAHGVHIKLVSLCVFFLLIKFTVQMQKHRRRTMNKLTGERHMSNIFYFAFSLTTFAFAHSFRCTDTKIRGYTRAAAIHHPPYV